MSIETEAADAVQTTDDEARRSELKRQRRELPTKEDIAATVREAGAGFAGWGCLGHHGGCLGASLDPFHEGWVFYGSDEPARSWDRRDPRKVGWRCPPCQEWEAERAALLWTCRGGSEHPVGDECDGLCAVESLLWDALDHADMARAAYDKLTELEAEFQRVRQDLRDGSDR